MIRQLYTDGDGVFREGTIDIPPPSDTEIRVRAVMTGVCRSDIAMMNGKFGPLPRTMHGHEGLGQVIEIGRDVEHVQIGNFVATRGEPAYADEYNVRDGEWVVVPDARPNWILEPIACGINLVYGSRYALNGRIAHASRPRACIIGTGFLAKVALKTLQIEYPNLSIDVIGKHNEDYFSNQGSPLLVDFDGKYDVVIDLKEDDRVFNTDCLNESPVVIIGAEKPQGIDTTFAQLLWLNATVLFPSPRSSDFYTAMLLARDWQIEGYLDCTDFFSVEYDREDGWQHAFSEANKRNGNYGRGYIKWR